MDIISAYQQLGSYRAAADACDTTHRTVKKIVDKFEADQAGVAPQRRAERTRNYDVVAAMVAERVEKSNARISAKRLLPIARAAGYEGSGRNSDAWYRMRKRCGAATIMPVVGRRSGHRVSIW